MNVVHKHYNKHCHSQTHATVDLSHTGFKKKQKNNRGRFTERKTRDSFLRTQYSKVGKEKPHSCKSCIAYLSCVENYPVA